MWNILGYNSRWVPVFLQSRIIIRVYPTGSMKPGHLSFGASEVEIKSLDNVCNGSLGVLIDRLSAVFDLAMIEASK